MKQGAIASPVDIRFSSVVVFFGLKIQVSAAECKGTHPNSSASLMSCLAAMTAGSPERFARGEREPAGPRSPLSVD